MRVEIDTTALAERNGYLQVKFMFFLDPGDWGYDYHHVFIPDDPDEKYPIHKRGKHGRPKDMDDYRAWADSLGGSWQDNPFHNHFRLFEPDVTDEEIMRVGIKLCKMSYNQWKENKIPRIRNRKMPEIKNTNSRHKAIMRRANTLKRNLSG